MADISDVLGVRTGSRAFTQAYLSRQIVSTMSRILPLPYFMMAMDGNKKGMLGIGVPNQGSLFSRVKTARSREKQIYGAESYQPLIHSQQPDANDGKSLNMRDTMSVVGGAGGSGAVITVGLSGTNSYLGTPTLVAGGQGYNADATVAFFGGGGTAPTGTLTLGAGGVITAITMGSGSGYIAPPLISIVSLGTSSDQHFSRPFTKWWERMDPIKVFKKPIRRLKNLMYGASKGEKEEVLANILKTATDEVRAVHLKQIAREMWGITTTGGLPTNQGSGAEVFDHLLSAPAAMQTTNTYGGVDRTVSSNAYWLGKRQTANKAADIVSLYEEANYTNGCLDIGLGITLLMCGPSLFPLFTRQVRAAGGIVMDKGLPEFGEFGFNQPVLKYNDMWIIYDPMCPDKLRYDPRARATTTPTSAPDHGVALHQERGHGHQPRHLHHRFLAGGKVLDRRGFRPDQGQWRGRAGEPDANRDVHDVRSARGQLILGRRGLILNPSFVPGAV